MKTRSRDEVAYHARVASLGCVCCAALMRRQEGRTTLHHLREGLGMGQRASAWLVVPLCKDCHQGDNGIHGDRSYLRILKMDELDLLAETIRALA